MRRAGLRHLADVLSRLPSIKNHEANDVLPTRWKPTPASHRKQTVTVEFYRLPLSGFTIPVPHFGTVQYGFDANSKRAQELLHTLERHLPLASAH